MDYLLKTDRLGLRNWKDSDFPPFIAMGQDPEVMRYFPKLLSTQESEDLIQRFLQHFILHGFTYFAVERLDTSEFIGFTGLMHQNFESDFTPCVDIGWRYKPSAWGYGYATEAARACLNAAYQKFNVTDVYSVAPQQNQASIAVMKRIGMSYDSTFTHPSLFEESSLNPCDVYKKTLAANTL
ncbi:GNAT family N-acetyltransferase [Altibacter sp. HG106]|uniref:GNAT family N-acetyltransferase n=1 Tax=Altibacter sp. HG106 TaxID=3023937 RepID=UPI002350B894|nr:GNAT family N-acetyltransferase [Altibacter sp. HG106]MDC7995536.1 GNAT family N-acetyltransferase [Altibacter sp. HG106]